MPAAKAIPAAVLDLALNDMKTATMVIYTSMTTNPANAAAITGVLLTRSGLVEGDFTVVSGSSIEVEAAAAPITAAASGTATCIILKTGTTATDGVIKGITTGTTVMTSGQGYNPSSHTYTFPAAV
jgi:hypothetical protein